MNFLTGTITNSTLISWKSTNQNLTFGELENALISYNYSDLKVHNADTQKIFILPYGYCYIATIKDIKEKAKFNTVDPAKLIMVDPNMDNRIRIMESSALTTVLDFSSRKARGFELKYFKVSYKLYDSGLQDGVTCTDYRY
jgi:hypothetical protein